ncbi:MAG: hypothetical protein H6631_15680 [Anaerolineaceae bacterium]|nr:hypothetical protein [Anaerolineaceae bacterium]
MYTWQSWVRTGLLRIIRSILFLVTLIFGTTAVMLMGETSGLALADLSNASVLNVTTAGEGILFAALQNGPQADGVYRSDDKGLTWRRIGPGPNGVMTTLVAHPTNSEVLFAGTEGGLVTITNNLWRSKDGGQTWHEFFISLPAHPDGMIPAVTAVAIDPVQPYKLFIGTDSLGVYLFNIGGNGLGYSLVGGVSAHRMQVKDLVIGERNRVYALTEAGLLVTGDGQAWHKLPLPAEQPVDVAAAGNSLYIAAEAGSVYHSSDGGQTWAEIGGDWPVLSGAELQATAVSVDQDNQNHAVVSTAYNVGGQLVGGSIYETYDAGCQWVKVDEAKGVITQLLMTNGLIYGVSTTGLTSYGLLLPPKPQGIWVKLGLPAYLTFAQILVILVTLGLASVILFGRLEWVRPLQTSS